MLAPNSMVSVEHAIRANNKQPGPACIEEFTQLKPSRLQKYVPWPPCSKNLPRVNGETPPKQVNPFTPKLVDAYRTNYGKIREFHPVYLE